MARGGSNTHDHPLDAADWLRVQAEAVASERPSLAAEMRYLADQVERKWDERPTKLFGRDEQAYEYAARAWMLITVWLEREGLTRIAEVARANAEGAAALVGRSLDGDQGGWSGILDALGDSASDASEMAIGWDLLDPNEARENRDPDDKRKLPPIVWVGIGTAGVLALVAVAPAIRAGAQIIGGGFEALRDALTGDED